MEIKKYLKEENFETNNYGVYLYSDVSGTHSVNMAIFLEEFQREQNEKLYNLLQEAKLQIEYLQEKFQATGSGNNLISRLETALHNKI